MKERLLSLDIDFVSYRSALERIISLAKTRSSGYVCFANVHMSIEAHWDRSFAAMVNRATLVLPDGMPLVKANHMLRKGKYERIAGMDAMPDLLKQAEQQKLKVFFFGSTPSELAKIETRLKNELPNLEVVGYLSPPFDKPIDQVDYINQINGSGANLVFVALGCPKQEKWMASHAEKIQALLLGVGGAFSVYTNSVSRAPKWMRENALEWLYRLGQEPSRLWRRYFITNSLFVILFFREFVVSRIRAL